MLATLINAIAIVLGGIIGITFRKFIKHDICEKVLRAVGIAVMAIAIVGVFKTMIVINVDNTMSSQYELLVLITIAVGTFIGESLKLDDKLNKLSNFIGKKYAKNEIETTSFSTGFINATLITCVGAISIVGSIQAALGDPDLIYFKSILDFITCIILSATLGYGVIFSAIPNFIYQALFVLLGYLFGTFMNQDFINSFSAVGYLMLMVTGLNLFVDTKIKVINMLPALVLVILYHLILMIF